MTHHVETSYAVNCSILLTELPLLDRAQAARDAGFTAVEFWWPFATSTPDPAEVDAFEASLRDAGVRLTGLNFNAGDMPGGERGLVSLPGRAGEFVANLDAVAPIGGTVLLEPVSGAEGYPLRTAADALAVIEQVGRDNVKLLADFFHLAANGDDVAKVIEEHAGEFGHVQIADFPGRGAPGTADLPLGQWIECSRELGYEGWVGLEYKQADEPFAFVGKSILPGI